MSEEGRAWGWGGIGLVSFRRAGSFGREAIVTRLEARKAPRDPEPPSKYPYCDHDVYCLQSTYPLGSVG